MNSLSKELIIFEASGYAPLEVHGISQMGVLAMLFLFGNLLSDAHVLRLHQIQH